MLNYIVHLGPHNFYFVFSFALLFVVILVQPFLKVDLSGDLSLDSLGEVRRHISLEIEIGELISLVKLQESSKLGVGVDLATIGLVLELVSADILVDITSNLSASHLGTLSLIHISEPTRPY